MNIVKCDEREADELVLLTKRFLTFVEQLYKENKISEQEYEGMIQNKIVFIQSMEEHLVCK